MSPVASTTALPTDVRYKTRPDAALALLRVVLGTVFFAHGAQKVFVYGFGGVIASFESIGLPLAGVVGPAVALIELIGGAALILGLFTRTVGIALAAVMAGATLVVHLPDGFFLPAGIEFSLTLLAGALAFVLAGPGALSVDALRARRSER